MLLPDMGAKPIRIRFLLLFHQMLGLIPFHLLGPSYAVRGNFYILAKSGGRKLDP